VELLGEGGAAELGRDGTAWAGVLPVGSCWGQLLRSGGGERAAVGAIGSGIPQF